MALLLLQWNEASLGLIKKYIDQYPQKFHWIRERLASHSIVKTSSEVEYHKVEPWIQWPSFYTGSTFDEHRVFRLGEVPEAGCTALHDELASEGFRVAAIFPINVRERSSQIKLFLSDPWSGGSDIGDGDDVFFANTVRQLVNSNTRTVPGVSQAFKLLRLVLRYSGFRFAFKVFMYALRGVRHRWFRALLLDFLLARYCVSKNIQSFDYCSIFFNGFAHIQHHYLFNSEFVIGRSNPSWYCPRKYDPIFEALELYELIFSHLDDAFSGNIVIATALSQDPYNESKFYYRVREPMKFIRALGLSPSAAFQRMSRDFALVFDSLEAAQNAKHFLEGIFWQDHRIFGDLDLDRSTNLLSVTFKYPREISKGEIWSVAGKKLPIGELVDFVAIKNGMHNGTGWISGLEQSNSHSQPLPLHKIKGRLKSLIRKGA